MDPNKEYKYKAFISYKHSDSSMSEKVASKLMNCLETFKFKNKVHWKICKDREEFSASNDLSETIKQKLTESEYLIVLLSPEYKESPWCNKEIDYFKNTLHNGSTKKILTVLVDGNLNDTFPDELKHTIEKDEEIEPFSIVINEEGSKKLLKNLKSEYVRLVAEMSGIDYGILSKREEKRKRKKRATIFSIIIFALSVFLITVSIFSYNLYQRNREITLKNSEGLCRESELLWNNGNTNEAIEKALSAIPDDKNEPYDKYVSYLLSEELGAFSDKCIIMRNKMLQKYEVNDLLFFNNGKSVFSKDKAGVYFWNAESGEKEKFIPNKDLGNPNDYFYLKHHNEKYVTLRSGNYTVVIDCESQKIVLKKQESFREIAECSDSNYCVRYDKISRTNTLYTEKPIKIEAEKIHTKTVTDIIDLSKLFKKKFKNPDMLLESIEKVYYNPETKEASVITSDDSYGYIFSVKSNSLNLIKKYKIDDFYTSLGINSYNYIATDKGNKLFFTYVTEHELHTLCIDSVSHKVIWENTESNTLSMLSDLTSGFCEDGLYRYYYYFNANKLTLLNADSGKQLLKDEFIADIISCVPYQNKLIIINKGFFSELRLSTQKNFRFTDVYTIPNNIATASYYDSTLIYSGDTSINLVKYGRNIHFVNITDKYGINGNQEYYPNPTDDYDIIKSDRTLYVYSKNSLKRIKEPKSSVFENIVGYTKGFLFLWNSNKNQLEKYDLSTKQAIHKTTCKGSLIGPPKIIGSYIVSSDEKKTYYYDLDLNDVSEKFSVIKREATDNIPLCLTQKLICVAKNEYLYIYDIEQGKMIKSLNMKKNSDDYPVCTEYVKEFDMLVTVCSNDVVYCFKNFVKTLDSFSVNDSIQLKIDGLNSGKFQERAITVSCIPEKNSLVLTKAAGTPYPTAYFYDIESFKKTLEVKNYQGYSKSRGIYVFNRSSEKKHGILQMRDKPSDGFFPFYSIKNLAQMANSSKIE